MKSKEFVLKHSADFISTLEKEFRVWRSTASDLGQQQRQLQQQQQKQQQQTKTVKYHSSPVKYRGLIYA